MKHACVALKQGSTTDPSRHVNDSGLANQGAAQLKGVNECAARLIGEGWRERKRPHRSQGHPGRAFHRVSEHASWREPRLTIDQQSVLCACASTTDRLTNGPSTMRADSPVVPPYEPPRLHVRGTRTDTPHVGALSSPTCPRVNMSSPHSIRRTRRRPRLRWTTLNPAACGALE